MEAAIAATKVQRNWVILGCAIVVPLALYLWLPSQGVSSPTIVPNKQAAAEQPSSSSVIDAIGQWTKSAPNSVVKPQSVGGATQVAYERGHYELAFRLLKDSATKSPAAAFLLGEMYQWGRGTNKNLRKALQWYLLAIVRVKAAIPHHLKFSQFS